MNKDEEDGGKRTKRVYRIIYKKYSEIEDEGVRRRTKKGTET